MYLGDVWGLNGALNWVFALVTLSERGLALPCTSDFLQGMICSESINIRVLTRPGLYALLKSRLFLGEVCFV